jgi:hypothetical protein
MFKTDPATALQTGAIKDEPSTLVLEGESK